MIPKEGIEILPGDKFVATGVLTNGKRFKPIISSSWHHIRSINLWHGSRWLLRNGKRTLIEHVHG